LKALGSPGGYTALKDHLATLGAVVKWEPVIRFETEPGWRMQADFANIRATATGSRRSSSRLAGAGVTYVKFVNTSGCRQTPL
jgi:hypothetical protein